MKVLVVLCLTAMVATMVEARYPQGIVYPFPIDNNLICRNPSDISGETVEQATPTLGLVPRRNDEVWLPPEIPFAAPSGTIDVVWLRQLLPEFNNGDYNTIQFERPPRPGDPPIGDPERVIEEGDQGSATPIPSLEEREGAINQTIEQLNNIPGFSQGERDVIRDWWDRISFPSCDDATYEVTELPDYYYPKYFVGGRCSGNDCSLPRGQNCLPSTRETVLLPVVRWDCCWDYEGAVWQWACGWRRVNIQIVTQCFCACRPILS